MALVPHYQVSGAGGEISPDLYQRVDLARFYTSFSRVMNMTLDVTGIARKRAGTRFVAEVADSSAQCRLEPFVFNLEQAYVLEIQPGSMRLYTQGARLESGGSPVTPSGTVPYAADDLFTLQTAQSNDVMWLAVRARAPQVLTRSGATSWSIAPYTPTANPFTGAGAYPGVVAVNDQRLVFANTDTSPTTLWFSVAGDFSDLTLGTADDSAFTRTVPGSNELRMIAPLGDLMLGSASEGATIAGGELGITVNAARYKRATSKGVARVPGVVIDGRVVHVPRSRRGLMEFVFRFEDDAYRSVNLAQMAGHLFGRRLAATTMGIRQIAYQAEPEPTIWAVRDDGVLLSCTYDREQDVVAWAHHVLGGVDAKVESVAVIPIEGRDQVWLCVSRTINGGTKRYVEYIDTIYDGLTPATSYYVDAGLTYSGSPIQTVTGLDHLEGETVAILADGLVHPQRTVSGGTVVLERAFSLIHIGEPYDAQLHTLPIASSQYPSVGKIKSWGEAQVWVQGSGAFWIGDSEVELPQTDQSQPHPFFTSIVRECVSGASDLLTLQIQSRLPLPMNVLAISGEPYMARRG